MLVVLDQFAQEREFHGGGPDQGWPSWSTSQRANNKVLIIASAGWFKCYEKKEVPGSGLGAAAEASIIQQRIYNGAGVNPDIRIVTFDRSDPLTLPLDLQRYHCFVDPDDFSDLTYWLTGTAPIVAATAAPIGQTAASTALAGGRPQPGTLGIRSLLTRTPSGRFLSLRGVPRPGRATSLSRC